MKRSSSVALLLVLSLLLLTVYIKSSSLLFARPGCTCRVLEYIPSNYKYYYCGNSCFSVLFSTNASYAGLLILGNRPVLQPCIIVSTAKLPCKELVPARAVCTCGTAQVAPEVLFVRPGVATVQARLFKLENYTVGVEE
ncbi:MAG: hypothetical protein GXO42_00195 [bacterium]|nr:hypothetical protein [bacterium]